MSHRRISRGARRHLLSVVERLAAPLMVFTVSGGKLADGAGEKIRAFLDEHMRGRPTFHSIIVPERCDVRTMPVRQRARVVAGKGGRRRGIRGKVQTVTKQLNGALSKLSLPPSMLRGGDPNLAQARAEVAHAERVFDRDPMRAHFRGLDKAREMSSEEAAQLRGRPVLGRRAR